MLENEKVSEPILVVAVDNVSITIMAKVSGGIKLCTIKLYLTMHTHNETKWRE